MKRTPWFPMWALFQDDQAFLMLSVEAELLMIRASARAKALGNGGRVSSWQLPGLCAKMRTDPAVLAAELTATKPKPLWVPVGDGEWVIPSYDGWNGGAEASQAAKAVGARRGNHKRWKHSGRFEDCPTCNPADSPGQSHTDSHGDSHGDRMRSHSDGSDDFDPSRNGDSPAPKLPEIGDVPAGHSHTDSGVIAERSVCESQTIPRRDETIQNHHLRASDDPSDTADALAVEVELADRIVEVALGTPGAVSDEGHHKLIRRALTRGWTNDELLDIGYDVARRNADEPVSYLTSLLKRHANEDPPGGRAARPVDAGPDPLASIAPDGPPLPEARAGDPESVAAARARARANARPKRSTIATGGG